jgi:hypothetical protein
MKILIDFFFGTFCAAVLIAGFISFVYYSAVWTIYFLGQGFLGFIVFMTLIGSAAVGLLFAAYESDKP